VQVNFALIKQRLVEGDAKGTATGVRDALGEDVPAGTILKEALIPGMEEVGDLFSRGEYFVPELLLAARAMSAAVNVLRPLLAGSGYEPVGKVVVGTVQGDLHDIGKKLVSIMLEGTGFEVVDLGTDVAPERFVEAVKESGAMLVGLSALLSTTLPAMEATVRAVHAATPAGAVRIMVGGAPVTDAFARRIGADGYGSDANAAVGLARRLLGLPVRSPASA
jgi:5-methyltetrahydrofolate--homocysteine methyltransferase